MLLEDMVAPIPPFTEKTQLTEEPIPPSLEVPAVSALDFLR